MEEEEDLLKEPLDGWSGTEGGWRRAAKVKGQEVLDGKEGQESPKDAWCRETIRCGEERPWDSLCEGWPGQKMT